MDLYAVGEPKINGLYVWHNEKFEKNKEISHVRCVYDIESVLISIGAKSVLFDLAFLQ